MSNQITNPCKHIPRLYQCFECGRMFKWEMLSAFSHTEEETTGTELIRIRKVCPLCVHRLCSPEEQKEMDEHTPFVEWKKEVIEHLRKTNQT